MDEKQSKELALKLLEAVSAKDVDLVIKPGDPKSPFSNPDNWANYGGSSKNWDRVGVQTSEAVGAIAELIINSIDAVLMRKAKEDKSGKIPASMKDAVRDFLGVNEGSIARLEPPEQTKLAEQNILVGVKRGKGKSHYPTYTFVDFGEGQNADKFSKTLLSLGEKNKEGIPFVQGRFNMGSTGSITFCTQANIYKGMYKLIMSKRTLGDSDRNWGWTLIRVREAQDGESLPVAQYFAPNGKIPKFGEEPIQAFGHKDIGVIDGGTIVKLYEYDIGPNAHAVDFGLYYALTTSLLECAIPIRIYDFDAAVQPGRSGLREHGIAARTFSGMKVVVSRSAEADDDGASDESNLDLQPHLVEEIRNEVFKYISIYATGIKDIPSYLSQNKYPYRCFYTVNGQSQAKERASFLKKAKLDDLRNHLIVLVNCDGLDNTAKSIIFKPDRERMNDNKLSRALQDMVVAALRDDKELRAYADKIRRQRATEIIEETAKGKELWNILFKQNPALRALVGLDGDDIDGEGDDPPVDKEFKGEKFPTKLDLIKPKDAVLNLPVNTHRRIVCETDVEDEYLARDTDRGRIYWDGPLSLGSKGKLRNGRLTFTVAPPKNAVPGETIAVKCGLNDSTRYEPLCRDVLVKIVPAEEKRVNQPGRDKPPSSPLPPNLPEITLINKGDKAWTDPCEFDDESGAWCAEREGGVTVYVNGDNPHLKRILEKEGDKAKRELVIEMFRLSVGILTLSMYKKMKDSADGTTEDSTKELGDWEDYLRSASSAVSAHVVTLIQKLGEARL